MSQRAAPMLIALVAAATGASGCASWGSARHGEPSLVGTWQVQYIGERAVEPGSIPILTFTRDGRFSGTTGCNRINGFFAVERGIVQLSDTVSTRMACTPELAAQETALLDALRDVERLRHEDGSILLYFRGSDEPIRLWP